MLEDVVINLQGLHKGQRTVLHHKRRFNIVTCGRRWGKTKLSCFIAVMAMLEGKKVGLFAPIFKDVEQTWAEIKECIEPLIFDRDETKKIIILNIGGKVEFWSLKDVSRQEDGRGRDYDVVIYDEFQKIKSAVLKKNWQGAVQPTLIKTRGEAWFFGTPPDSRTHYCYELVCLGALNNAKLLGCDDIQIPPEVRAMQDSDFITFRAPSSSNPLLPSDELESIKRRLPSFVFQQEVMCKFVESSNDMFLNALQDADIADRVFSRSNLFNPRWEMKLTFDFNRNPMAALLIQHNADYSEIRVVKEFGAIGEEKVNIDYTCEQVKQWLFMQFGARVGTWGNRKYPCTLPLMITGDATGRAVHASQSDSLNFFQLIRNNLGLNDEQFILRKANQTHAVSFLQMNQYLEQHKRIFIDPTQCPRLKADMFAAKMTAQRSIDKKGFDPHYLDALRYFFQACLPVHYEP